MRKNYIFTFALFILLGFVSSQDALAQFTIKIPKIPKINKEEKKEQPPATTTTTTAAPATVSGTPEESKPAAQTDWWVDYQVEEITKYQKKVDEWDPETNYFPTAASNDDYQRLAVSPKERQKWLKDKKVAQNPKLDAALDALAASLAKQLARHLAEPKAYNFRNPAEEKLMTAEMADVPGLLIHKIGLNQSAWVIDKNDLGIPINRYKRGMIWGRNPNADHPHCQFWYVNLIQDYSGGGTYGTRYARFVGSELAGCPAK